MEYVIETGDDAVTEAMSFEAASTLFEGLTGVEIEVTELVAEEEIEHDQYVLREATLPELCIPENGMLNVEKVVDNFSPERMQVAYERASRALGGLTPHGEEDDSEIAEAFKEEFALQLRLMVASDTIEFYEREGLIEVGDITEDGNCRLDITEKGKEVLGIGA